MEKKIKVMIVDDSLPFRSILSSVLQDHPRIEVVSTAYNGSMCLSRIKENKPDIITLDYEMPDMNGVETLEILHKKYPEIGVIMLSAMTTESASITMKAINAGADDFLLKAYEGKTREENIEIIKKDLAEKIIRCYEKKHNLRSFVSQMGDDTKDMLPPGTLKKIEQSNILSEKITAWQVQSKTVSLVFINVMQSHIGLFIEEMKKLNMKKGIPIIAYIKMPESFLKSFVDNLKPKVNLSLKILENGDSLLPRIVYFVNGINRTIAFNQEEKIKAVIKETDKDLSEDEFFKSVFTLKKTRVAAFLMAESIFSPGILGLKELKNTNNISVLLYTKTYREEDVKLVEKSYSEVATSVLLPMHMAEAINTITSQL